jgi:DNA-binding HxlR family transcriptional regulator
MALLDLLGRRMSLRILWELSRAEEPLTFRGLQSVAETNPALLNNRLRELREAGFVTHEGEGYVLNKQGRSLVRILRPLSAWADQWASTL